MTISETTGRAYIDEDCYFFKNPLQSAFYMKNGAELQDIFVGGDNKFVYVYKKSDHQRLKIKWRNSNIERDKVNNDG